jgi:GNAT superfamily N-acetyltransferase
VAAITTVAAADAPLADVRAIFAGRGDPADCWCQYFKQTNAQWTVGSSTQREAMLCDEVGRRSTGVIAYSDGLPVGWCNVEPRPRFARLPLRQPVADETTWAIPCFVVRVGHRKQGVSAALLRAAVSFAFDRGARSIEAYPIDTAVRSPSAADLYHGALSTFERAGFSVVSRPATGRAIVLLEADRRKDDAVDH